MGQIFTNEAKDTFEMEEVEEVKEMKEEITYDKVFNLVDTTDYEQKIYQIWKQNENQKINIKITVDKNVLTFDYSNRDHFSKSKVNIFGPKYVIFRKCGDGHTLGSFPDTQFVLFDSCDKNFNYYTSNAYVFPKLEKIYMAGHPAEYTTRYRFPKEKWIVSEHYERYFNSYYDTDKIDKYKIMKYEDMIKEFNELINLSSHL
jgi:hypothetical protein